MLIKNIGVRGPKGDPGEVLDTGWRKFPDNVFTNGVYTGQTVTSITIAIIQRRIANLVYTGFTFRTDDPARTATAGNWQVTLAVPTDHMWPTNTGWAYGGSSSISAVLLQQYATATGSTLSVKRTPAGTFNPYCNISFYTHNSVSELVTGTTYFAPPTIPIISDAPWPTTLPGVAYNA